MIEYKYNNRKFIENGHIMTEFDVLKKLQRLAHLEYQIKQGQLLFKSSVNISSYIDQSKAQEHRERLQILEKHVGEYYYMIGNIHNGISDAMEEYHKTQLKLLGIPDVVGQSEQFICENEHCDDGIVDEVYGEKIYCEICASKSNSQNK